MKLEAEKSDTWGSDGLDYVLWFPVDWVLGYLTVNFQVLSDKC
jgi:hypothetical protein